MTIFLYLKSAPQNKAPITQILSVCNLFYEWIIMDFYSHSLIGERYGHGCDVAWR